MTIEDADEKSGFYKNLWLYPLIQGGILLMAGIVQTVFPEIGLIFLSLVFGLYLFILGIGQIVLAFKLSDVQDKWWQLLIRGALLVIAGILILWFPFSFARISMTIPLVTGGLFLIVYSLQNLMAPNFRSMDKPQRIGDFTMIILGVLLCIAPVFSALMIFRIIGVISGLFGLYLIIRALSLR